MNTRPVRRRWQYSVGHSRICFELLEPRRMFSASSEILVYPLDRPLPLPADSVGFKWQQPTIDQNRTPDPSRISTDIAPPSQFVLFEKDSARAWGPRDVGPTLAATVDWGDGSASDEQITFSEGRVYFTQEHAYANWGTYQVVITSGAMPEPYTLQANVTFGNGPFEVVETPEVISYADPYNAVDAPRPLMRFRGESDPDEPTQYFAEVQVNGDSHLVKANVVPVNGAPGLYDVQADLDFIREGDYDVTITLTRGIDRQRILGGETFFADRRQLLATVHGTALAAGAYVPASDGDPVDVFPTETQPADTDGVIVSPPPGAPVYDGVDYIHWRGATIPAIAGEWIVTLDRDLTSWIEPTPINESQWGGDSMSLNERGLQAELTKLGGGLRFEQYLGGDWVVIKAPLTMNYGQLRALLMGLPGFAGAIEPDAVQFTDVSMPIEATPIATPSPIATPTRGAQPGEIVTPKPHELAPVAFSREPLSSILQSQDDRDELGSSSNDVLA